MLNVVAFYISCSLTFFITASTKLEQVRLLYEQAPVHKASCEALISLLQSYDEKNPLFLGYKGCAHMIMAKHVPGPFSKLSYFRKGRNMLEKAIQADSLNTELRFLRYTIQTNTPALLGYGGKIKTDRAFLLNNLEHVDDSSLRIIIRQYLDKEE